MLQDCFEEAMDTVEIGNEGEGSRVIKFYGIRCLYTKVGLVLPFLDSQESLYSFFVTF